MNLSASQLVERDDECLEEKISDLLRTRETLSQEMVKIKI